MSGSPALAIIVQARMGSTRLPGKVMFPVVGRPLLDHLLDRLDRIATPHRTVVATTRRDDDDPIARLCAKRGVAVYRGSADDVLDRYFEAAMSLPTTSEIARVTADCPVIDPQIVDRVIRLFRTGGCDYASNTLRRTFPRGLDVEVFTRESLGVAATKAREPYEREHVTPYIYRRPDRFRLCNLSNDRDEGAERWTVDTPEDFELVSRIIGALAPRKGDFGLSDVRELLDAHPEWRLLNAHVEQKPLDA